MATKNILYKDIDLNFNAHPDTGDVVTLSDEDSISRSVKTLVLTRVYERVMHPEKGSQISGLLFEQDSPETRMGVRDSIKSVLTQYEPRIVVKRIDVNAVNGAYDVVIWYSISDTTEVQKTKILLTRVR